MKLMKTKTKLRITFIASFAVAIMSIFCVDVEKAAAVSTTVWEISSFQDFLAGELTGVTLSSDGDLRLGPKRKPIDVDASAVWSVTRTKSGNIYVGTANPAALYLVTANGIKEVASFDAIAVTAIVEGTGNSAPLYIATMPGGKLYRVKNSESEIFHEFGDEVYLWDLEVDAKGNVYVATGPKGIVYRVSGSGKLATEVIEAPDDHILTLAKAPDGSIYAGTSDTGLVYKIDSLGTKGIVWYDFDENEIVSLAVRADGTLIVAANKDGMRVPMRAPQQQLQQTPPVQTGDEEAKVKQLIEMIAGTVAEGAQQLNQQQRPTRVRSTSNVYALSVSRELEHLLELPDSYITDIGLGAGESTFLATGERGQVYELIGGTTLRVVMDLPEPQAAALVTHGGKIVAVAAEHALERACRPCLLLLLEYRRREPQG